jgi:serine/threonine protein kinase
MLGKGSQGNVYEVKNRKDGHQYALKVIDKSFLKRKQEIKRLKSEVTIQKYLSETGATCENIIQLKHHFEDENNVYMMLEICSAGDLSGLLKKKGKLAESEAKRIFKQLVRATKFLKKHLILHRDLKPGNIFITTNDTVKIGDFGCSAKLKNMHERRKSQLGTPNYLSPEINNAEEYSYSCDVWSLGCILYIMLVGKPPFESRYVKQTYRRIMNEDYVMPKFVSEEAQDLLKNILKKNVDERLTIEQI